ncbi:MAG: hypothetical protein IPK16_10770 [Anaerolineales bacterium]|nr:hypothetical protein [Anaerolineales bacterium]
MKVWPRVILVLSTPAAAIANVDYPVRRLVARDAAALANLDPNLGWISKTWGGPDGLAQSGFG